VVRRPCPPDPWGGYADLFEAPMDDPKPSPFALNRGRILILALGAMIVVIAISTWFGGINAYQALREANTAAVTGATVEKPEGK
jgi:hypothetical protein